MTQAFDSYDQSPHGAFVQTAHGDARNAPLDFVLGGSVTFTHATLPNRTIVVTAFVDSGGVLYSFGTNNTDFVGGDIQNFEEYNGTLYAGGQLLERPTILGHSEGIYGQMFYNKNINDWDNVGKYDGDMSGFAPEYVYAKNATGHSTLVFGGNNPDGWSNDWGATYIAQTKQIVGWNGTLYRDIMGTFFGDIAVGTSVAKFNNTVYAYIGNAGPPFENAQMRKWDGDTVWTTIGPDAVAFGPGVVTVFDAVKVTLNGVTGEHIFAALNGSSSEQRYSTGGAWTIFTTLGDYDVIEIVNVVKYKSGVVLYGEFSLTAAPFTGTTALHWRDDDNGNELVTIFAENDPTTAGAVVFGAIGAHNNVYVTGTVNDGFSDKFAGFGEYVAADEDYKVAWKTNSAYSEYDIIDATGRFQAIGRFDVGKLKKTDPQP
jgi:hypothetical protein